MGIKTVTKKPTPAPAAKTEPEAPELFNKDRGNMVYFPLKISAETKEALWERAHTERCTKAEIVRRAIDEYLAKPPAKK